MKEIKEIIRALKVFGNDMILYNYESGETISFQDVVDFVESQNSEIERLTEELEKTKDNRNGWRNRAWKDEKQNAKLQKQVEELKEQKGFWEGMHDRVCLKLEEYDDKSEEYENALIMKQYIITELQKQIGELKEEMHKTESSANETYMLGFEEGEKYAVKDTVKKIFTEVLDFVKGWFEGVENNDFIAEFNRILKNLAEKCGVEVE